jgi:hypothetical protein
MGIDQAEHHGRNEFDYFIPLYLLDEHRNIPAHLNAMLVSIFALIKNAKLLVSQAARFR